MFNVISFLKNRFKVHQLSKDSVLVLAYHNVEDRFNVGDDLYTITTVNFIQHMSLISKFFTAITPEQLFTTNKSSKPRILITFDDGKKNNFTQAFPVLHQFNLPALFFITAEMIDTDGYMTEEDIMYISARNIIIGSHGLTHADFGKIDMEQTKRELKQSKEILEKLLFKEVSTFAYPYGNDRNVKEDDKEVLFQLGYKQAYVFGGNTAPNSDDPYRLPRLMVTDVLGTTFLGNIVEAIKNNETS